MSDQRKENIKDNAVTSHKDEGKHFIRHLWLFLKFQFFTI